MLKPAQITSMRATLNRTLVDTATILRATRANVGGEEIETWNLVTTAACRITHIGGGETGEVAGRVAEESTHLVTVAAGTDIEEADRVVLDMQTYVVTLVRKRGSWELSRRVEVKELA